jgi:pectin methylesterase-like acyl-CoA thioesterase
MPVLERTPQLAFATIAEALAAASTTDTVLLESGTYDETLEVTTDAVTLRPATEGSKVGNAQLDR